MGAIIIEVKKTKVSKNIAKISYGNELLQEQGIKTNDAVYVQDDFGIPFWIDGKEYHWINNRHVLAKLN